MITVARAGAMSLGLLLMAVLGGCDRTSTPGPDAGPAGDAIVQALPASPSGPPPDPVPPPYVLPGDDVVVVTVDGAPITRYELETAFDDKLGIARALASDDAGERQVLETLMASRALAQRQLARLDARALAILDRRVAVYREQLLVKMYLDQAASPEPVSEKMVREYYERHPDQFEAKRLRVVEMLFSTEPVSGPSRARLDEALAAARERTDWDQAAVELVEAGYPVGHRRARVDVSLLTAELRDAIEVLAVGEVSAVAPSGGRAYLARVVSERRTAPRPLAEVSGQIRRMLLPTQVSKAVKEVSAAVVSAAQVEYRE